MSKLNQIRNELHVPKTHKNNFGNYFYRNLEDIQQAVKPLTAKYEMEVKYTFDIIEKCECLLMKCTAILVPENATLQERNEAFPFHGWAELHKNKPKMSPEQWTGSAQSYAAKYALNHMFLLDDCKDPDSIENVPTSKAEEQNKIKVISDMILGAQTKQRLQQIHDTEIKPAFDMGIISKLKMDDLNSELNRRLQALQVTS